MLIDTRFYDITTMDEVESRRFVFSSDILVVGALSGTGKRCNHCALLIVMQ